MEQPNIGDSLVVTDVVAVVVSDDVALLVTVEEAVEISVHAVILPLPYSPMARFKLRDVPLQVPACLMIPNSVHATELAVLLNPNVSTTLFKPPATLLQLALPPLGTARTPLLLQPSAAGAPQIARILLSAAACVAHVSRTASAKLASLPASTHFKFPWTIVVAVDDIDDVAVVDAVEVAVVETDVVAVSLTVLVRDVVAVLLMVLVWDKDSVVDRLVVCDVVPVVVWVEDAVDVAVVVWEDVMEVSLQFTSLLLASCTMAVLRISVVYSQLASRNTASDEH